MESAKGPRRSSGRSRRLRRDLWWGGILRGRGHREAPSGSSRAQAAARYPPPAAAAGALPRRRQIRLGPAADLCRASQPGRGAFASGRGREKAVACTILFLLQGVHVPVARRRTVSRTTSFYETLYRLLLVWKLQLQSSTLSHCVGSWHEHEHVQATVS